MLFKTIFVLFLCADKEIFVSIIVIFSRYQNSQIKRHKAASIYYLFKKIQTNMNKDKVDICVSNKFLSLI